MDEFKKGTLYECHIIRPPADYESDSTPACAGFEMKLRVPHQHLTLRVVHI